MTDGAELELSVDDGREPVVVAVVGEVDTTVADRFRTCLVTQADLGKRTIVVDMSGLRFMDSSGLKALIDARKSLGGGGSIVLRQPTRMVRKLLEVTGAAVLFEYG